MLGFCENYKHVVINAHHELILIRARNDNNCIVRDSTTEPKFELFKIQWRMPHVTLNKVDKLSMLRVLERTIFEYEFPFMGSVRVSSIAEHDEALVGYQDGYSVREAEICLCSAD